MRSVALRVVLVLHWVVDAVTFPHQVVVAAQHGGVDLVQFCGAKDEINHLWSRTARRGADTPTTCVLSLTSSF